MPGPKKISDIKSTFSDLAQSSHYEVQFHDFPFGIKQTFAENGVLKSFYNNTAGLLCYNAVLPGSSLATTTIEGNFTGVQQQYAHTKIFNNINLSFYCDSQYQVLRFFESWMQHITGGSNVPNNSVSANPKNPGYFYRMRYPRGKNGYKCDSMRIYKFDRNYKAAVAYSFVGLFPVSITSTPIGYESQNSILRISIDFNYERHYMTAAAQSTKSPYPFNFNSEFANLGDAFGKVNAYSSATQTDQDQYSSKLAKYFTSSNGETNAIITQQFIDGINSIKGAWNPTTGKGSDIINFINDNPGGGGSDLGGAGAGAVAIGGAAAGGAGGAAGAGAGGAGSGSGTGGAGAGGGSNVIRG